MVKRDMRKINTEEGWVAVLNRVAMKSHLRR